ncbi:MULTISPECIES: iron-siderophore ABC transporter substrate-binding protein [unclassified Agarivorans]|uniref:iron-siderophore ABC transporter substrate-binding protein n=1 Tax=unclassified Agarivorans TaxID=2636026 RepID=UPI003D7D1345
MIQTHCRRTPFIIKTVLLMLVLQSSLALALTINDDIKSHHFAKVPQRIVALNWSMAENVLELGLVPVGIADIAGYQTWVVKPAIPAGVTDVGTRMEPNLELIEELKPDVILLSSSQADLLPRLEKIAPTLFFDSFNASQDNYQKSKKIFMQLAELFDKQTVAAQKLTALEKQFVDLKQQISQHFSGHIPKVTTIRFNNASTIIVYGDNSLSQAAAEQLGIAPALPLGPSKWGIAQKKLSDLAQIEEGIVVNIKPFDQEKQLQASPLWQALPFVRKGHYTTMEAIWSYGGVNSVGYFAQALTDSLLNINSPE